MEEGFQSAVNSPRESEMDPAEAAERAADEERAQRFRDRRNLGRNVAEINALIIEWGIDTCLNETGLRAGNIWGDAEMDSPNATHPFYSTVPQAASVGPSGLSYMIDSIPDAEYDRDVLVYVCKEFLRLRLLDYEMAWGFDNSLPFYYRDGTRISWKTFGGRDTTPEKYFLRHQWHLNDNAYNRLVEEVQGFVDRGEVFSAVRFRELNENFPVKDVGLGNDLFPWSDRAFDDLLGLRRGEILPEVDATTIPFGRGASTRDGARYPDWYLPDFFINLNRLPPATQQSTPRREDPRPTGGSSSTAPSAPPRESRGPKSSREGYKTSKPRDPPRDPWSGTTRSRSVGPKKVTGVSVGVSAGAPGAPGGSSPSSSSSSVSASSGEESEDYKKRQYAKGGDFQQFGDTSMRESKGPVHTYRREKGGGLEKLYKKLKKHPGASKLTDEKLAEASFYLGGVQEILESGAGGRRRPSKVIKETKRDASGIRLKDFDVDYDGTTLEEILGDIFNRAVFRSDVERQNIAKDLLQMVLFSDRSSRVTKDVALEEYSKLNTGALLQQTMDMATGASKMGMTTVLVDNPGKSKEVPYPVFGKEASVNSSICKNLMTAVGGKRLHVQAKEGSKPLLHALPTIASAITSHGLNAEAAFTVMLNLTDGPLYDYIYNQQNNSNFNNVTSRFQHMWKSIQHMSQTHVNAAQYEDDLQRIILAKPGRDINETLLRIQTYVSNMFENHPNEADKRALIREKTLSYLRYWVETHFAGYFATIDSVYEDARKCNETAKLNAEIQGIPYESDFDPIDHMIKIILNTIYRRSGMFNGINFGNKTKSNTAMVKENAQRVDIGAAESKPVKPGKKKAPPMKAGATEVTKLIENVSVLVGEVREARQIQNPGPAHNAPRGGYQNQRPNNGGQGQDRPMLCKLCNRKNHQTLSCFTYNEKPGDKVCEKCGGRHVSPCKWKPSMPNRGGFQPRGGFNGGRGGSSQGRSQGSKPAGRPDGQMQMGQGIGSSGRQAAPAGQ
jgi:hypothetical protein